MFLPYNFRYNLSVIINKGIKLRHQPLVFIRFSLKFMGNLFTDTITETYGSSYRLRESQCVYVVLKHGQIYMHNYMQKLFSNFLS